MRKTALKKLMKKKSMKNYRNYRRAKINGRNTIRERKEKKRVYGVFQNNK